MNPRVIVLSEFLEKKSKFNWEKVDETQIRMVWDEELRPTILKDISQALMDSRDLPHPYSYYGAYAHFFGNPVLTGMGFIDTFDKKTKKMEKAGMSIKKEMDELEDQKKDREELIKYYEEAILSLEEDIEENKEMIKESEDEIKKYKEKIEIEKDKLVDIKRKINTYQNKKPKIFRIKPLGEGRLFIELERNYECIKSGTIRFFSPPFLNRIVGFPTCFFEQAYISQCATKLCWTIDHNHKIEIDIEEFLPYIK